MVAIPSSPQSHLQVAGVAEPLELLLLANLVGLAVAVRQIMLLHKAAVVAIHLLLRHLKAITAVIAVHHLLIQIMLAAVVAEQGAWAEMLQLLLALAAVLAVMEVQAVRLHFQVVLLFTHGAAQAVAIMMAITALPLLVHKAKQVGYQHLQTQVAEAMVEMKLAHGQAATAALVS
jgi:hypothetical protein